MDWQWTDVVLLLLCRQSDHEPTCTLPNVTFDLGTLQGCGAASAYSAACRRSSGAEEALEWTGEGEGMGDGWWRWWWWLSGAAQLWRDTRPSIWSCSLTLGDDPEEPPLLDPARSRRRRNPSRFLQEHVQNVHPLRSVFPVSASWSFGGRGG